MSRKSRLALVPVSTFLLLPLTSAAGQSSATAFGSVNGTPCPIVSSTLFQRLETKTKGGCSAFADAISAPSFIYAQAAASSGGRVASASANAMGSRYDVLSWGTQPGIAAAVFAFFVSDTLGQGIQQGSSSASLSFDFWAPYVSGGSPIFSFNQQTPGTNSLGFLNRTFFVTVPLTGLTSLPFLMAVTASAGATGQAGASGWSYAAISNVSFLGAEGAPVGTVPMFLNGTQVVGFITPEPASMTLLATGLLGLGALARRRKQGKTRPENR